MATPLLVTLLVVAWLAYLVPLAVWVVMQRREPVATLSWLLALAVLPYTSASWSTTSSGRNASAAASTAANAAHAKALLVDDDQVIVGSANFDPRSFRLNFELVVRIHDATFAASLERQLEEDFDRHSRRVSADRPEAPFRQRFVDSCARLLSPVL